MYLMQKDQLSFFFDFSLFADFMPSYVKDGGFRSKPDTWKDSPSGIRACDEEQLDNLASGDSLISWSLLFNLSLVNPEKQIKMKWCLVKP